MKAQSKEGVAGENSILNKPASPTDQVEPPVLAQLRERIVRFAASRVQGEAAEDVAQEVMLVLHEKYASVDRPEELVPLAIEIARFKIMALRRKVVRRGEHTQVPVEEVPLAAPQADPYEQAERQERLEQLEAALRSLGDRCRELFRLKLQGLSFPEIQARLGVDSLNTLYTWDFRCRKQLQEKLAAAGAKQPQRSKQEAQ